MNTNLDLLFYCVVIMAFSGTLIIILYYTVKEKREINVFDNTECCLNVIHKHSELISIIYYNLL